MADETLQAEAIIGIDADRLVNSEIGQVMIGIAKHEAAQAIEALLEADPNDAAKGAFLRAEVRRHRQFESYLRNLYVRGKQAMTELDVRHAEVTGDT